MLAGETNIAQIVTPRMPGKLKGVGWGQNLEQRPASPEGGQEGFLEEDIHSFPREAELRPTDPHPFSGPLSPWGIQISCPKEALVIARCVGLLREAALHPGWHLSTSFRGLKSPTFGFLWGRPLGYFSHPQYSALRAAH